MDTEGIQVYRTLRGGGMDRRAAFTSAKISERQRQYFVDALQPGHPSLRARVPGVTAWHPASRCGQLVIIHHMGRAVSFIRRDRVNLERG